MDGLFDVIANDTYGKLLTKGKKYRVFSITFPKFYPKGLFLVCCDNGRWERITAELFEMIEA